jgi:hypothetical protein
MAALTAEAAPFGGKAIVCLEYDGTAAEQGWNQICLCPQHSPANGTVSDIKTQLKIKLVIF